MIRLEPRIPQIVSASSPATPAQPAAAPVITAEDPDFPKWVPSASDAPKVPVRKRRPYELDRGHDPVHRREDEVGVSTIAPVKSRRHMLVTDARITNGRVWLPEFDYYEFDPDGTPYRIRCAKEGRRPAIGPVKPIANTGSKKPSYSLRKTGGGRKTVSATRLREMISGERPAHNRFVLAEFPNYVFDDDGNVFSAKNGRPITRFVLPHRNGWPVWGYRLYYTPKQRYVKISSHAVSRMRFGKCSMFSCEVPMGWQTPDLHGMLGDYCVDPSGTPYRIANRRQSIYEPQQLKPVDRAGNRFHLTLDDGTTRFYTRAELLSFCRYDTANRESVSEIDGDVSNSTFGTSAQPDPSDALATPANRF